MKKAEIEIHGSQQYEELVVVIWPSDYEHDETKLDDGKALFVRDLTFVTGV